MACWFVDSTVDLVEIGERQAKIGEVLKVKPLGVLAMIDEGELDWKVVAISIDDPKADLVNDVADVEKHFPVGFCPYDPLLYFVRITQNLEDKSICGSSHLMALQL